MVPQARNGRLSPLQSNDSATATSKMAGGLDKLTLDSLYDDAIERSNQYDPWEAALVANAMMQQPARIAIPKETAMS